MEYDLAAVKKIMSQQKNELKNIGSITMGDLKNLKHEFAQNLLVFQKEQKENQVLSNCIYLSL